MSYMCCLAVLEGRGWIGRVGCGGECRQNDTQRGGMISVGVMTERLALGKSALFDSLHRRGERCLCYYVLHLSADLSSHLQVA
jgi:hypothetical protein